MRSFQRLWNALLCTVSPRKKFHRGRARNLAAVHWAVLESLELRTLFSALYWDVSSAPGLQAGSGTWSTSAANWNTAADGSGSQVAWTAGSDAVFSANGTSTVTLSGTLSANSITVSGTGYTLSGGTLNLASTSSVSTDLTLSSTTVNNSGTFTWSGGNLALGSHSTIGGSGTINLNGGSGTISQTNNWLGGSGTVNWSSGNVDFSGVSIFAVHGTFDGGDNTFDIHGGSSLDAWNLTWNSGDVSIDNLFVESGSWNFLTLNGGDYNWTITGTFQYDGGFFAWDSGTLNLNDALVKGTSSALSMTVPEGATLNVSGTFALNNATITNDGTINFDSTDTSALPDLTNDGTVIFSDPSVDLVSLTGSGTATEGSIYTLTIGSVSGDITDTITDYYVDWGDGTGLDDFTSAGGQTHVYAGSTDATTDYTITVHLVGAGTWVDTASAAVTVDDVAPVVTLDDPGTTTTAPTLTGTAGITPGDASTVTLYIYAGSSATGTPVDTESVDVDPDAGMFSYTVDSGSPLAPGTYTFQATQEEDAGNTSTSDPVTFTVALQDPGIVTNLVATPASPTEIDLSWDTPVAADYVTGFSVYRSTDYGQTFTLYDTASSSATGMNITGLDEDTDYMFNVVASNDTGDSPDNVTSASQPLLDIEAPTDLEVTPVDDGANGLELTWNDNSTGETSYEIEAQWGSNGQFATIDTIAANSTSYNTSNWMTSGIYVGWITEAVVFRVRAVGPGQSAYSDPSDPVNVAAATAFMNQDAVTDLSAAADPVSPGFDLTWSQTDVHSFDILYRKQGSVPGDYGAWT
ncbi:MAG TPA: fibronectin type III domain-containing protein, partial [Verrucomicrobiae bacterium]|nr:fibronectin type III domain-containing protein [Verrucomicrobiae bacterium]